MEGATILVVDDCADNRTVYGSLLEFFGCRVLEASNGLEGVRRAIRFLPDLIVMDVAMPVMSGIDATRQLKADPRTTSIPLLILTANDTLDTRREAKAAGCDAFLAKPAAPSRILREMERLLAATTGSGVANAS